MNRLALLILLLWLFILDCVLAIRWSNINALKTNLTIEAVEGTSSHGSNRILCYPLTWPSLATFYIGNFGAHIATVQSMPGDKWPLTLFEMVLALFFPTSGLMRGLNTIVRNFSSSFFARKVVAKIFRIKRWRRDETSLEKACKAGALCVVVRNANWRPKHGQADIPAILSTVVRNTALEQPLDTELADIESVQLVRSSAGGDDAGSTSDVSGEEAPEDSPARLRPKETILTIYRPTWLKEAQSHWWTHFDTLWGRNIVDPTLKAIHGTYRLPVGYSFSVLPRDTIVLAGASSLGVGKLECEIAASYSILKVLASLFQLLAATYTLWLYRGDQVNRWGFASFSFVPVPYAIMSLVNGISHLCTPDYPAVYMVSSTVMKEAEDAGGGFYGIVGYVEPAPLSNNDTGYGSGFDTTWKGLTPGVLRRTLLSLYNSARGRKKEIRELTVFEQRLPEHARSGEETTQTDIRDENTGLSLTSHLVGSPVLLVEQSPNFRGESYMISPVYRSENFIESIAYKLPRVNLEWIRYGTPGIIVLSAVLVFNLGVHPKKTYCSIKMEVISVIAQVQSYWGGSRKVRSDTASNIAVKGSRKQRLLNWFFHLSPSVADINLEEQLRGDQLPRISFRACECFQRQSNLNQAHSTQTTTPLLQGLFAQGLLAIVVSSLSLLVIGLMSSFDAGSSSRTDQIILMMWLAVGIVVGFLVPFLNVNDAYTLLIRIPLEIEAFRDTRAAALGGSYLAALLLLLMCLPWGVFVVPVWGFVIVSQQLEEWGTCVSIY